MATAGGCTGGIMTAEWNEGGEIGFPRKKCIYWVGTKLLDFSKSVPDSCIAADGNFIVNTDIIHL